jgi:tetratricopeptide (TPR) repeat protein
LAYAHALTASALLTLQKFPEALDAATKALDLSPKDPDVAVQCALVWASAGRPLEALPLIEGAIAQHPAPPYSYFTVHGYSLLLANRLDDTLKALHQSYELKPEYLYCLFPLVVACVESGDLEQAKAHGRFLRDQIPALTADDNAFVDRLAVPADRARVAAAFRRAGL